jgi:malonyl-CoA decarboxylase
MSVLSSIKHARDKVLDARDSRRLANLCRQLLTERGQPNSVNIATSALKLYENLGLASQHQFFNLLAEEFDPDPGVVLLLAERYAVNRNPDTLLALSQAAESPRQELFRRLNRAPGGTAVLVHMRELMLKGLATNPHWRSVDADFEHLLSSWFNPGFLQMQKIDWGSPARLLEQLIAHEAVHAIVDWNDLRRRLQPDRRCFAFFHPALPLEPLIFVEVALLSEMPNAVGALLDEKSVAADPKSFKVATFYSISNCQPGLRGISLGNFLIKQVAKALSEELPQLKTFCTLSPIPSFGRWLSKLDAIESTRLKPKVVAQLSAQLESFKARKQEALPAWDAMGIKDRALIETLCGFYLLHTSSTGGHSSDPVARFHLGNGARLERVNPQADLSKKAAKESHGFMVNYLYDLDQIEANHEAFMGDSVQASRAIKQYF